MQKQIDSSRNRRLSGLFLVLALALLIMPQQASAATATADVAIAVDVRTDECRAVGQADIGYSPSWGGITNAGAYVVLQKVVAGVTNTVATFAADAEHGLDEGDVENRILESLYE